MPSVLNDFIDKIETLTKSVTGIDKRLVSVERNRTPQGDGNRVSKMLSVSGAGQNPYAVGATIGFDGADELGFFQNHNQFLAVAPKRQKAVGMGQFLVDTMLASEPNWAAKAGGMDRVMKRIAAHGSKPVQKSGLVESAGVLGGYTVPVQFYMELMRLIAEESFTRALCTVIPMQSQSLMVPALLQSATPGATTSAFFAGITGTFQPETASITNTQPNFRNIELVARNLVFTCVASNQLLQDNAVALDTLLTTLFKEAMAWFFDWYVLNGIGSQQPLGILKSPALIATGPNSGARQVASQVGINDLAYMFGKLLPSSYKTAVWVVHPSVLYQLIIMTGASANSAAPSGGLAFLPVFPTGEYANQGSIAPSLGMKIFGLPVIVSEKVPPLGTTGDVLLVDFAKYLVGDRMAIQIETSPHILFQNNQLMWRVIQRWDGQPWVDAPITLNSGGADTYTVSPMIALHS